MLWGIEAEEPPYLCGLSGSWALPPLTSRAR